MKITYTNGPLTDTTGIYRAVKYEAEYADDQHVVTARLLETLHAKGILTKEDLGTILNLDIVEITP